MKKGTMVLLGILAVPVIVVFVWWTTLNGIITANEHVNQTYSQVQNVMQRQSDLIPNLVATVKANAAFETKTLTQVMEARSRLSAVAKMDPKELAANPKLQEQLVQAQAGAQQAMVSLQAVREAYPQLGANQAFRDLMAQLEGSINRITVERRTNQLAVEAYNLKTRTVISGMIARNSGYEAKPYFAADEGAAKTPVVKFE